MNHPWQQPIRPLTRVVQYPSGEWSARIPVLFIRWSDKNGLEIVDELGIRLRLDEHNVVLWGVEE